ncbi:MAG: SPASM domain-containing protein, partial [Rubrivivax sp.]|nr:SPASM domain-containing protein [Rubrivivax sp.]
AYYQKRALQPIDRSYLYFCGAGLVSFHIDPYGELSLCMLARQPSYNLRQGTFQEGWQHFPRQVRFQPASQAAPCNGCQWQTLCSQCPGMNQLEYGDSFGKVDYLCEIAHLRAHALDLVSAPAVVDNLSGL